MLSTANTSRARHRAHQALRRRYVRGVTLIETLMVTAVTGILAASVVPNLSAALEQQQLTAATNELVLAVNLARVEATTRKRRTVVAPRIDRDWSSGWHVFIDHNDDGRLDADEPVVRAFDSVPKGMRIQPHFGIYRGDSLSFDHFGNLRRPGSGGFVLGRMTLELGANQRAVCFSALSLRTVRALTCG